MKITGIETIPVRVPIHPNLAIKSGRGGHHSLSPFLLVKVGIDPESDVARVKAVREAVGRDVRLGVDANGGWKTVDSAVTVIDHLGEFDIYFVEQPVAPGDIYGMHQVHARVRQPIIADE